TAGQVVVNLSEQPATLPESAGYPHMAIHPYPRELVQSRELRDGRHWVMRPIRPEDALPLQQFIRGLSPETRYMRFVSMLRELTPQMLSRYTRIDYDRELAIVAAMRVPNPEHRGHYHDQIIGFAHYLRNADSRGAEIALVVGDDWQRQGLGKQLLGGLIQAARWQEFTYLDGYVLPSNTAMLALMQGQGFVEQAESGDPEMRYLVLDLSASEVGATV
ncbi:MAG TPA: GNAT family N-acetyltransferase, partial [Burkholderiaceae bacterium]|nr:GNAT family N-acetyltransferase [Burkholderiaceae bacterium]